MVKSCLTRREKNFSENEEHSRGSVLGGVDGSSPWTAAGISEQRRESA